MLLHAVDWANMGTSNSTFDAPWKTAFATHATSQSFAISVLPTREGWTKKLQPSDCFAFIRFQRVPACCTGQCNRYICCVSLILFHIALISPWLRPRFALSTSTPFCLFLHGGKAGKVSLSKLGESPLPWTPRPCKWSLSEIHCVKFLKKCALTSPTFRRLYWIQFTLTIQSTKFYETLHLFFVVEVFFFLTIFPNGKVHLMAEVITKGRLLHPVPVEILVITQWHWHRQKEQTSRLQRGGSACCICAHQSSTRIKKIYIHTYNNDTRCG